MENVLVSLSDIINDIESQGYYADIPEFEILLQKNYLKPVIFVNSICVHGNYIASHTYEQITSDKFILYESDFDYICPLCDTEKSNNGKICCPKCGELLQPLNKLDAINFALNEKFILYDTNCQICNSSWI